MHDYIFCRSAPRDHNATYSTRTTLLRRQQAEQYELQCTCPLATLQRTPKTPQSPMQHVRSTRDPSPHTPTMTIHRSPRLLRHVSLKKTVTAEDNEYEHIWQSANNNGHHTGAPASNSADVISNDNPVLSSPKSDGSLKSSSKLEDGESRMLCDIENKWNTMRKSASDSPTNQKATDVKEQNRKPHYVTRKDIVAMNDTMGRKNSPKSPENVQKFSTFLQPSVL